ncbi:MAG: histidine kinase [Armatimonadota bacterium]
MMQTSLSLATLSGPFEASLDAVIVVNEDDRIVYANPAVCQIKGSRLDELLGRDAYEHMPPHARDALRDAIQKHAATQAFGTIMRGASVLMRHDGAEFEIEYTAAPFMIDGQRLVVIMFRDVTETRRLAREVDALTRIASQVAFAGSLEATLDKLAQNVVHATGTVAAGVCLLDVDGRSPRVFGSYGIPKDPEAEARWQEAVQRGARMPNLESVDQKKTLIHVNARRKLLDDPAYEPIRPYLTEAAWDTVVSVPLIYHDRAIGALNVFYPRGKTPGEAEIAFLTAIADQAAVAAENARLFEEAREKAVLEERQRLARELHDSVSQALYGIALGARTARTLLDREPAQAAEPLDYVLSLAEAGLTEMRALIFELRPESLDSEGLIPALTKQIESVQARHGLEVHAEWCEEPDLPYEIKEAVYRIAQEALNNIIKHARARRVDLRLDCTPDTIVLEVRDDGVGFASEDAFPGHLGLRSMRERAARLGATLEVVSAPGQGAQIRVRIPRGSSA